MKEGSKNCKRWVDQDKLLRILFCCLFVALFLCLPPFGPVAGHTATVTLSWNKNTESNIAGYKVSYGTSSGSYTTTVDAGNITSCTLSGLQEGKTYYFAAKAYNTSGLESSYSNQVSYSVPTSASTPTSSTSTASTTTTTYALTPYITEGKDYGSISPSARVYVNAGSSMTFTMTPKTGCQIKGVWVDGSYVGTPTSYTFQNVQAKHYIDVKFMPVSTTSSTATTTSPSTTTTTYALTPYITEGKDYGSISPSARVYVNAGSSMTFTMTPKTGRQIKGVWVDGSYMGTPSSYTFQNVQAKHYIVVKFQ